MAFGRPGSSSAAESEAKAFSSATDHYPRSAGAVPPTSPPRKSSKRPVSTTSENWLAQSSGKKALTASNLVSMTDADRLDDFGAGGGGGGAQHAHSHRRQTSHSHRPKSSSGPRTMVADARRRAPSPPRDFGDRLIYAETQPWSEEKETLLLAPYDYLFGHPGKDVRGQLIAAFNEWLKVPEDRLKIITKVIGMLQTSSLLWVSTMLCIGVM
jgi:geranylgeranyl diphosphate synthase type 3